MIATGLTFLFGFFLACLLALMLSPIVWRRSRRMARREFEATIPTSANEIRASYDHVRAAAAIQTRTREMDAAAAVERAAHERANAGRISLENAGLRERNSALITLLSEHKAAFEEVVETLEFRESEFDKLEAELNETRHEFDLRSEELDVLARKFRVLVGRAEQGGVDTGFDADDLGDDIADNRPSRIEMQKTIQALTAEIETLQTGLRQQQSTVRDRDATILDLLAGVATATAGASGSQATDGQPDGVHGKQPNGAGQPDKVGDAIAVPTVVTAAPETSGKTEHVESGTGDPIAPAADAINGQKAKQEAEDAQTLGQAPARVQEHFPAAPPATSKSHKDALATAMSFSSIFANRIREALKRPQAQAAKPAGSAEASTTAAASVPAMMGRPTAANLPVEDAIAPERAGSAPDPSEAATLPEAAAPASIAKRLREALQLPEHPLGTDDIDDETLRLRIVDLAARVIDKAAKIEGKASPIETILTADRSFSSLSRPRERQTLTDRVRVLRSESEAAE